MPRTSRKWPKQTPPEKSCKVSNSLRVRSPLITTHRCRRKKWTEAELLIGVTPEMVGGEIN